MRNSDLAAGALYASDPHSDSALYVTINDPTMPGGSRPARGPYKKTRDRL